MEIDLIMAVVLQPPVTFPLAGCLIKPPVKMTFPMAVLLSNCQWKVYFY
jgi:hypothetical protein